MNRLLKSMQLDFTVQGRNYFYHIGVGSALLLGGLLWYFFNQENLAYAIPLMYLFGLGGSTYLFVGALILVEKRDHTLDGLIVTPLRPREYINAKVISMTILGLFESLGIAAVAYGFPYGWDFNWFYLITGVVFMAVMNCLLGLIVVVRYDSINNFLMPTLALSLVLQLPFVHVLGFWESPLFYLIPSFPSLQLVLRAFDPTAVSTGELVYGFVGSMAVIIGLYIWGERAFDRHIIQRTG